MPTDLLDAEDLDVVVHGTLGAGGLLRHLRRRRTPELVEVDLRAMSFCEPLGLVALAAFVERVAPVRQPVVLRGPVERGVANYLARMRVGAVLAELGAEHDLPTVSEHLLTVPLLELTGFEGAAGAEAVAALVQAAVDPVDPPAAVALWQGLCEAGQNVAQHSGRRRGWMAAQRTHGGRLLSFAVGDSGRGVRASLRARGATSDADALDRALVEGVTSTDDLARGMGLPAVRDHVTALGGRLDLASGTAGLAVTAGQTVRTRGSHVAGTFMQGTLPVERRDEPRPGPRPVEAGRGRGYRGARR